MDQPPQLLYSENIKTKPNQHLTIHVEKMHTFLPNYTYVLLLYAIAQKHSFVERKKELKKSVRNSRDRE